MDDIISFDFSLNERAIANKIESLIDDKTMLEIHQLLAKMCNDYVPADTTLLASSVQALPEYVYYPGPYAHYMYMGEVYGPNYPIYKDGVLVGWRSPPGKGTKYPKGYGFDYSTEVHPQATHHWDKAMFIDRRDEFLEGVRRILVRRAKELYG